MRPLLEIINGQLFLFEVGPCIIEAASTPRLIICWTFKSDYKVLLAPKVSVRRKIKLWETMFYFRSVCLCLGLRKTARNTLDQFRAYNSLCKHVRRSFRYSMKIYWSAFTYWHNILLRCSQFFRARSTAEPPLAIPRQIWAYELHKHVDNLPLPRRVNMLISLYQLLFHATLLVKERARVSRSCVGWGFCYTWTRSRYLRMKLPLFSLCFAARQALFPDPRRLLSVFVNTIPCWCPISPKTTK